MKEREVIEMTIMNKNRNNRKSNMFYITSVMFV